MQLAKAVVTPDMNKPCKAKKLVYPKLLFSLMSCCQLFSLRHHNPTYMINTVQRNNTALLITATAY